MKGGIESDTLIAAAVTATMTAIDPESAIHTNTVVYALTMTQRHNSTPIIGIHADTLTDPNT